MASCSSPHDVAAGDLNNDGNPDLVVACWNGNVFSVHLGNGDGTFAPKVDYVAGAEPHSVALGDFNRDGRVDVAIANHGAASNGVSVLLGTAAGGLGSKVDYPTGDGPHAVRAGDLDGDGLIDLVTANARADTVSVLLGNGNGTFDAKVDFATGRVPKSVAMSDVNGDGGVDVITANTAGNGDSASGIPDGDNVSVLLGDGAGSLGAQTKSTVGLTPFAVALGDFDRDGRHDLVTADWDGGSATVRLNVGAIIRDTAAPTVTATGPADGATGVAPSANVTATFSEGVTGVTGWNLLLVRAGTVSGVPAAVSYDAATRVATLNPSTDLVGGVSYTAIVRGGMGGVADATGNVVPADVAWTFTTATQDTTPPTVSVTSPAANATGVAPDANVTATFSEPMNAATIDTARMTLVRQGTGTPVAAAVTYDAANRRATLNPSANLQAGAVYTATVDGGAGGVTDVGGNLLAADHTWSFTVAAAGPTTTFLSNLTPLSQTNAWGPIELDRSNGEKGAADGRTLTLNGVTYAKGVGVHAASDVRWTIPTGCTTFVVDIGIDDEVTGTNGGVVFQVFRNTTSLYTSPQLNASSATIPLSLNLGTAGGTLRLVAAIGNNGANFDHADWAGARLVCG